MKFLIVNADDFGMTAGINAGVVDAHRRGVVTSASLMVKQPAAEEAARLAAAHPSLGLGLHVDLAEWELGQETYTRVDVADPAGVAREIEEQRALFVSLVGHAPDHLDSHQHVHFKEPVREESLRLAKKLGVPLRNMDSRIVFCGDFYGRLSEKSYPEGISLTHLLRLVEAMPDGWTELMCHPGHAHDVRSVYAVERETELAVLCDPGLPRALAARGVELVSFTDFNGD
jgi:chitin disaccharide deacetylase